MDDKIVIGDKAYRLDNGDLIWNTKKESLVSGYHRTTVVVGQKIFVSLQKNELICIDGKNGSLLWSFKHENEGKCLVAGGGLVFLNAGQIFAFDENGNLKWTVKDKFYPEMAFVTGKLVVSTEAGTMALSEKTGKVLWKNNLITRAPVICGTKIIACLQKTTKQEVEAIVVMSLVDGKEIGRNNIEKFFSFPAISTVVARGCVFVGKPWHGQILCYGDKSPAP